MFNCLMLAKVREPAKTLEFGTQKCLLQRHVRRPVTHAVKYPPLPEGFQGSNFKSQVREGDPGL